METIEIIIGWLLIAASGALLIDAFAVRDLGRSRAPGRRPERVTGPAAPSGRGAKLERA